jgi:cell division protease FtsH
MSNEVANGDVDADIFHEQSKTINIVDIKNALSRRFKPEHISRFGNIHIIYPSLSKASYEEIIRRHTSKFLDDIAAKHGIMLQLDQSVFDFLYRNGVFPTQGVRPIFTTISSYVENSMPKIMMKAIDLNVTSLRAFHKDNTLLVASCDPNPCGEPVLVISIPWIGAMDKIRDSRNEDLKTVVSVHEAGHAIMYAILFGHIPSQILSSATGFGGVTYVNANTFLSKATVLDKLCMCYAGMAAEELVFGEDMLTLGSQADIETATDLVVQAMKESGMFGMSSLVKSSVQAARTGERVNIDDNMELNQKVEKICSEQRKMAKAILSERLSLVRSVADVMIAEGQIRPDKLQTILKTYGIEAALINMSEMVIADYNGAYDKFASRAIVSKRKLKFKPAGIKMKRGTNVNAAKAEPKDDDY